MKKGSLTGCLKKFKDAGIVIDPRDKRVAMDAAAAARKAGLKGDAAHEALTKALREHHAGIEAEAKALAAQAQPQVSTWTPDKPATLKERAEAMAAKGQPVHQDPGEAPEVATKAVVTEAIKTAADNRDRKPSEMRAELLRMIDQAIPRAKEADDPDVRVYESAAASQRMNDAEVAEYKRLGPGQARERFMKRRESEREALRQRAAENIGYVTLKVPGDGTFKVLNTVDRLKEFRAKVESSPGFKDSTRPPDSARVNGYGMRKDPGSPFGVERGSGGPKAVIENMIDDGDPQAAVDYAAARGLVIADVLKGDKVRLPKVAGLTPTAEAVGEFEPEVAEAAPAPSPAPAAQAAASRTRPVSTIDFAKPIVGPSGARLLSYTWQWKPMEFVDARGEERVKRISDWDASEASGDTGRDVVHQFVVDDNGTEKTVSAESALKLLGFTAGSDGRADFNTLSSAAKTLARLRMQEAELQQAKEQFDRDNAEVQALPLPAMPTARDDKGWFNLGDASVRQIEPGPMNDERRRSLIGAWRDNRLAERGWRGGTMAGESVQQRLGEVADRIKRQQAKVDKLVAAAPAAQPVAEPPAQAPAEVENFSTPAAAPAAAPSLRERAEGVRARASSPAAPAEVQNFGEALPPARRAMAAKLDESLSDDDIANRPLSEIWPLAENEAIEDTFAAAVAHAARAEVPAKPRVAYKLKQWVQKVKTVRELAGRIVSGRTTKEQMAGMIVGPRATMPTLRDWWSKVTLLEQVPRDQWKRIGEVEERPDAAVFRDGKPVPRPMVRVRIDDKAHWIEGGGTVADALPKVRELLSGAAPEQRMEFAIYERRSSGTIFVTKKGDPEKRSLMEFATVEEARAAVNEYDGLAAAWEAVKGRDNITERDLRSAENRPRTGKDHRGGKDVTVEQFQETFGFRGGEFGKWVQQGKGDKERQALLNQSYDALMDLADIIGVPPRAMSLNGTLGLALGSRGSGWASAHFEPSNLVINLTKTRGAGTLAHEWFHALDNYFSRMRRGGAEAPFTGNQNKYRDENYITHRPESLLIRKDRARGFAPLTQGQLEARRERLKAGTRTGWPPADAYDADKWERDPSTPEGVRPEVEQRFAALVQALKDSPMAKRAALLDKSGGYWTRTLELAARSFENYVIAKMHEQGYHNDFLVNVKKPDEVAKSDARYPYLLAGEVKPIADAFDALFSEVKTRDSGDGNVALFSRTGPTFPTGTVSTSALSAEVSKITANWDTDLATVKVVPTVEDLPAAIRQAVKNVGAENQVRGLAMPTGEVYLVAENIGSLEEGRFVLFHEVYGHVGMRAFLGDNYSLQMRTLKAANPALAREADAWFKKYGEAETQARIEAGMTPEKAAAAVRDLAVEEALADRAGNAPAIKGWQRLVAALQRALRRMGLGSVADMLEGMSEAETLALLVDARATVRAESRGSMQSMTSPVFQRAYHGTAARGIKRFSTEYMGTGEGAQAYGWGLYFAGKKEIADWYRQKLAGGDLFAPFTKDGRTIDTGVDLAEAYYRPGKIVRGYGGADKVLEFKRGDNGNWMVKVIGVRPNGEPMASERARWHSTFPSRTDLKDALEQDGWKAEKPGQLYEVDIPEDSEMLLWDKPLSEQPAKVRQALMRAMDRDPADGEPAGWKVDTGQFFYRMLSEREDGDEAASEWLMAAGIKGIKYLDGTSRGAGDGTFNYVVFSGDDVAIREQQEAMAPAMSRRTDAQQEAKALGLPATGPTDQIARLVQIARADPRTWTREDFDLIAPHLAVHQDTRDGAADRMQGILSEGLTSGMVDSVGDMASGKRWTWARGLMGKPAYVFISGGLKYQSASSPWLVPGNKPLFAITPQQGQGFYEALQTAVMPPSAVPAMSRAEGLTRRNLLLAAAATAAPGARADTTLGRAKPVPESLFKQALPADIAKALRGNGSRTTNLEGAKVVRQVLDQIAKTGPEPLRALAAQVRDLAPASNLLLTVDDTGLWNAHGAVTFGIDGPHLKLFTAEGRTGLTYGTFLHEVLHVAVLARYQTLSVGVIRENDAKIGVPAPAAAAQLAQFRALWEEFRAEGWKVKPKDDETGLSVREAMSSPDEFFVRALTDGRLQEFLAGIEYRGKTLLERFKDWVKTSLLGFRKEGTTPSWLDAALAASLDLNAGMGRDAPNFERLRAINRVNSQRSALFSRRADQTQTPEFKRWFGDSKVVDAEGKPLVVYHGTLAGGFTEFKPGTVGTFGDGIYFARDPETANFWAGDREADMPGESEPGGSVYPVYVSIKNPADEALASEMESLHGSNTSRVLQEMGYDGIIAGDEIVAFRPEQIKSAIGNRGTFDPTNADIRFSRTADLGAVKAQDLLKDTADKKQKAADKMATLVGKGRQFWLGAFTRDQLADTYGKLAPEIRQYDKLTRAMENERSSLAQRADELYERWSKLPAEVNDRLARIMLDATVEGVHPDKDDPGKGSVQAHAKLRAQFKLLPKDAQAMYAEVRDFHGGVLKDVRKALIGRINRSVEDGAARRELLDRVRMQFDQYLEGGPYFPLHRFGDWLVVAERDDGERVVAAYENAGEQQQAARELRAQGFRTKLKTAKEYSRSMDGSAGKFIEDVIAAVEKVDMVEATIDGSRSDLKNQLLDDINQLFIKALPDLSYRKHFAHRKNTPGFTADVMRGFASSAFHAASHIARLNHADQMTMALEKAYDGIDAREADGSLKEGDYNTVSQVLNEMVKRHEHSLNPDVHPLSTLATQVGFVWYLGVSPAAGLINMAQVPMVTIPYLGSRYGFGKATAAMGKAYKDILAAKPNRRSGFNAAQSPQLSADERGAITTLQDEGVIDLTQAHDLAAATDRDVGNQARSKASFAIARAMRIIGWTFHVPEVMNRQVTALMAYRLEREKGGSNEVALEAAREAIKRSQFDYSSSNRARYMQGNVVRVITQFKQYAQNMTYFIGRAAHQALKDEDPEVRRIARRQLLSTFAVTGLFAGTLGMPVVGFVGSLIEALVNGLGDDEEPWDWETEYRNLLADNFGKEWGEVFAKGAPRMLMPAWDIADRVALSELWWRSNDRVTDNPREAVVADMGNILGPTFGTILSMYRAGDYAERGEWDKAMEAMMPKAVRDVLRAARETSEGVTAYNGDQLMELTGAEAFGRAIGFGSSRASEMFAGRNAVMNAKSAVERKRQLLLNRIAQARLDGDREAEAEARSEVAGFNERNPEFRITNMTIARSIATRRRNRENIEDGILLPDTKASLREIGRFANIE